MNQLRLRRSFRRMCIPALSAAVPRTNLWMIPSSSPPVLPWGTSPEGRGHYSTGFEKREFIPNRDSDVPIRPPEAANRVFALRPSGFRPLLITFFDFVLDRFLEVARFPVWELILRTFHRPRPRRLRPPRIRASPATRAALRRSRPARPRAGRACRRAWSSAIRGIRRPRSP